jgi:hypothetical protein
VHTGKWRADRRKFRKLASGKVSRRKCFWKEKKELNDEQCCNCIR